MTFEEICSMIFQPGMSEIVLAVISFVFVCNFLFVLFCVLMDLISALIRRFIWPGKKSQEDKEAP